MFSCHVQLKFYLDDTPFHPQSNNVFMVFCFYEKWTFSSCMTVSLERSYLLTWKNWIDCTSYPVFPGFHTCDGNWSQSAVFLWFPFWQVLLTLGHLHLWDFSPCTQLHWNISMKTIYFLHGHAHYKYFMWIFMNDILLFHILFWKGNHRRSWSLTVAFMPSSRG